MKTGLLLSIQILFFSCASNELKKFGAEKYFRMKRHHLKSDIKTHVSYDQVGYVASKENHCFQTVDDREVYTVLSSDIHRAVQHFYFRSVSYDVKKVNSNGNQYLLASANEEKTINLEVAYCTFESMTLFRSIEGQYASFRVIKD